MWIHASLTIFFKRLATYLATRAMSCHMCHVRPHVSFLATLAMSGHMFHVRPYVACLTMCVISGHTWHIQPHMPCLAICAMSDHMWHIRPYMPCLSMSFCPLLIYPCFHSVRLRLTFLVMSSFVSLPV